MSAIWGILRFDGAGVADRDIDRMGAAMAVRCGDGSATFLDGSVGLGHGLMRVTREDAFDQQPLYDRDAGLVLVADCRIDNREEIAVALDLDPATLATMPDSAIVLHAYRRWGDSCAAKLIGDFAFAVWDVARKRLLLARDHMGQRALHYHLGEGFFAFATDITALWAAPGVPRALDEVSLGAVVNFWGNAMEGRMLPAGIRSAGGGTTLAIGTGGTVDGRRYWEPHADPAHLGHDDAYYVANYRKILEEAVACRVRRLVDRPGLSLSGGFDSGSIAALAGPALPEGGKLVSVTSAMPERAEGWPYDPRPWVELCKRDMPHLDVHYIDFRDQDPLDGLEEFFAASGGLPVTPSAYADAEAFGVLKAVGARLIMDGEGGDYTLNDRGQMALANLAAQGRIPNLLHEMRAHRRVTGERWRSIVLRQTLFPLLPRSLRGFLIAARRGFRGNGPLVALKTSFTARLIAAGAIRGADRFPAGASERLRHRVITDSLFRQSAYATALEAMAASYGLALTRPFFDRRVVEFALAVPRHLDVRDGRNRYLACAALQDVLPGEFQDRPRANDGPIADPLSLDDGSLREAVALLETTRIAEFFDFARIRSLLDRAIDPDAGTKAAREQARRFSILSLVAARYTDWLDSRNR
ncbi:asparagine synthase-related protein [Sphingomonas psychrolutea]|uniref:asparagine synthase (glutamine-hydrolyzing) n=1 Tax=Sphingomonas psychrolutea TaxID=1259676 RepID=A0ABQ1H3R9_9SPHN|nr:asparagine synthase-related protein [Sphingomonas psychrolutea]GGA55897.1 asparagine synthetase B [Sphingomonas psychrolutea]